MKNIIPELKLWALAVILVVVGFDLTKRGHLWKPAGEALIIAGALAVTVDRYVKLRLRAEIAEDVFFAALGVHLPIELKEEMLAIREYKLVRRNLRVVYTLSPHEDPGLVNCEIDTAFDMQNFTHRKQEFNHVLSVADAPSGAANVAAPVLSVKGESEPGVIAYEYTDRDIVLTVSVHSRDFAQTIHIPAKKSGRFSSKSQHILPAEWEDPFILAEPTINVVVTIVAPPEISNHVIFDHRFGNDVRPKGNEWALNEAFLPNTLFRVVWRRESVDSDKKDATSPDTSEATS